jgi:hypothetical protein
LLLLREPATLYIGLVEGRSPALFFPTSLASRLILTVKLEPACGTTLPRPGGLPGIAVHADITIFRVDLESLLANLVAVS